MNYLYKHTQLEDTFHINTVALVHGVPQTLSLKTILEEFIVHRIEVIRRRTKFDLTAAEAREHILLGLKKALDHIDEIIKLIRASKDVRRSKSRLDEKIQIQRSPGPGHSRYALQKLAGLERQKVLDELKEVQALIESLKGSSVRKKGSHHDKDRTQQIKAKYENPRRTKIIKHGVKAFNAEDLIPDEESVLVLTKGGYIKRTNPDEYRKQKRGGVGVVDLDTKEEDFITHLVTGTTHNEFYSLPTRAKLIR